MTPSITFRHALFPKGSKYLRNTNLDPWAWLTGRGLSMACGFDWEPSKQNTVTRDERIATIGRELADAQARYRIDAPLLDNLLAQVRDRAIDGQKHAFLTLNWDSLLQEALDRCAPGPYQPEWLEDSAAYHLNGSFQGTSEAWASNVILPDDPPQARKKSPEFGYALAKLEWAARIVILGVSMGYPVDRTILDILSMNEDYLPVGEASVVVVDREPLQLGGELRRLLPAARVSEITTDIGDWVRAGLPGLEESFR